MIILTDQYSRANITVRYSEDEEGVVEELLSLLEGAENYVDAHETKFSWCKKNYTELEIEFSGG